jgi:hypothetical protein
MFGILEPYGLDKAAKWDGFGANIPVCGDLFGRRGNWVPVEDDAFGVHGAAGGDRDPGRCDFTDPGGEPR